MWPLACLIFIISVEASQNSTRSEKQLSVFTVVKFPNSVCLSSTSGRNGTCYTQSECAAKGGSSSGSCASSFGVCCVFEKSCGDGTIAENCTYFTSASRSAGSSCSLTICKQGSDVCQLRLDFETFTLSNPQTNIAITLGIYLNRMGQCETDFFSVSVPGAKAPPLICGENSGMHMYVPATDSCNVMSSFFGTGTTTTTSAFTIKVTQVKCDSKMKAPHNCLQYFTAASGTFQTYNFGSGGTSATHLANQDYCFCLRADRTSCTMCYATDATNNLGLGIDTGTAGQAIVDTLCGTPAAGIKIGTEAKAVGTYTNYDHIIIPGGQCPTPRPAAGLGVISVDRYCGNVFNCVKDTTTAANGYLTDDQTDSVGTVCTSTKPFQVCFKSDDVEGNTGAQSESLAGAPVAAAGTRGFRMNYWQLTTCVLRT